MFRYGEGEHFGVYNSKYLLMLTVPHIQKECSVYDAYLASARMLKLLATRGSDLGERAPFQRLAVFPP